MTELHNLYETAIQIIEKTISLGMSQEAIDSTTVSALLTDKGNIYTGINGNRLENNIPTKTCSEYEAITAMMMSGENRIIGIVSVLFKNRQVTVPCDKCRELICRINPQNITCGIMTDENTAVSLQILVNQSVDNINNKVSNSVNNWDTGAEFWGNDEPVQVPNMNNNMNNISNNMNGNMNFRGNNYPQQQYYNGGYPQHNNNMMSNQMGYYGNINNMNNMGYMGNMNNMGNNYYQQNSFPNNMNQNPYDYVNPIPPSNIQRNGAISKYSNVSGNIYVHSTVTSQGQRMSENVSKNVTSENIVENNNSIYRQKLKDLLSTDSNTEEEEKGFDEDINDEEMKNMAKMDAKYSKMAAKKLAKANKKKKSIFDRFI